MASEKIELDVLTMQDLFGISDTNVRALEKELDVMLLTRDGSIEVTGTSEEHVQQAVQTLEMLSQMRGLGEKVDEFAVSRALESVREGRVEETVAAMKDVVAYTYAGAPVKCRTLGQRKYIRAIEGNTVTIAIGPAGTGKTYLAVAAAVRALKDKKVNKIVMCRPAVEAGEKLGFLPGDLQNKVDPYLRPLYDALDEMLGPETVQSYLEKRIIEIAPLAYMRGRTLKSMFLLCDECQNMSVAQHLMILTRLGEGSKMVLTGDITQIDLPSPEDSGLERCAEILEGIEDIKVIRLSGADVVRHKLVGKIISAFEKHKVGPQQNAGDGKRPGNERQAVRHGGAKPFRKR
ncbi:MAG: PhoH family protein [Lawsonibacter sp.]